MYFYVECTIYVKKVNKRICGQSDRKPKNVEKTGQAACVERETLLTFRVSYLPSEQGNVENKLLFNLQIG